MVLPWEASVVLVTATNGVVIFGTFNDNVTVVLAIPDAASAGNVFTFKSDAVTYLFVAGSTSDSTAMTSWFRLVPQVQLMLARPASLQLLAVRPLPSPTSTDPVS